MKIIGIFVNDRTFPFAALIVMGAKLIETRTRNMLKNCIGCRVAIVQTGCGRPRVIGYVDMVSGEFKSAEWLNENRDKTRIPPGNKFDTGRGKWCYYLENAEICKSYELPADAVRHGRSWCEFQID